jgi:hypothetical protein
MPACHPGTLPLTNNAAAEQAPDGGEGHPPSPALPAGPLGTAKPTHSRFVPAVGTALLPPRPFPLPTPLPAACKQTPSLPPSPMTPLLSRRQMAVRATPVMGPLTSGSRMSFRKGSRYSRGGTRLQSEGSAGHSTAQDSTAQGAQHITGGKREEGSQHRHMRNNNSAAAVFRAPSRCFRVGCKGHQRPDTTGRPAQHSDRMCQPAAAAVSCESSWEGL